jgi:hypothetical protein
MTLGPKRVPDPRLKLKAECSSPKSGQVGSVVHKVTLGQVLSEYFGVPCQLPFHRLLHIHLHRPPRADTVGQIVADIQSGLSLTPQKTQSLTNQLTPLHSTDSKSQSRFTTRYTANQFVLARSPLRLTTNIFFQLNACGYSPFVTSCPTRGWVCRLQLKLVLASAVFLMPESRGTHDHILLSQIRDSPNLEGQVPVFISPRNRVALLYPQALGSLLIASYDSQGYAEVFDPAPHGIE